MSKIITLSEDQIWAYSNCPVQFEMAQRGVIPIVPRTFKSCINKVSKMFFTNLMEGTVLDMQTLKLEWDKVWAANSDLINQKKGLQGYAALNSLYKWAESVQLRILDIMIPYALLFYGKDNLVFDIRGQIPCVSINQANQPAVLIIDYNDKHTDQVRTDMNLRYSLACFALKQQTGRNIGIHVRNTKHCTDTFSYRAESDYERLKTTITNIGYCIANKIFYPREGPVCTSCSVMGACRSWTHAVEGRNKPWLKSKNI